MRNLLDLSDEMLVKDLVKAAANLVRFFQHRGAWCPFSYAELLAFYRLNLPHEDPQRMFYGLQGAWFDDAAFVGRWRFAPLYIVRYPDGTHRITNLFIEAIAKHVRKGVLAPQNA